MTITTKRILGFITGASLTLIAAWLIGYDFNERGGAAVSTFVITLFYGGLGASYPFRD